MGNQLVWGKLLALFRHATGHQVRVAILFRHVVIDASKGILQRVIFEIPDRPVAIETFMDQFLTITKSLFSKELWLPIIRVPAAMFDPPAQKIVFPWHEVGIRIRSSLKKLLNL